MIIKIPEKKLEFEVEGKKVVKNIKLLSIRQIIDDPLLKRLSVTFFETAVPLLLWNDKTYDALGDWTKEQVCKQIEKKFIENYDDTIEFLFVKKPVSTEKDDSLVRFEIRNFLIKDLIEKEKNEGATIVDQAISFSKSLAKWSLSKFAITPQNILKERQEICKLCPEWDSSGIAGTGRCKKCGCSTQAKLRMASESCPINKWTKYEVDKING